MILYFALQQIEVETLEKGFLVNVYSERSCPGLLVAILQVLEDLGLSVLEARVSCTDTFRLQAFGGEVRLLLLFNLQIKPARAPLICFFFFIVLSLFYKRRRQYIIQIGSCRMKMP